MPDKQLETVYNSMTVKCSGLMVMQDINDSFFGVPNKIENLKAKYSYVEAEMKKRGIGDKTPIADIDTVALKMKESVKAQYIIDKLGLVKEPVLVEK